MPFRPVIRSRAFRALASVCLLAVCACAAGTHSGEKAVPRHDPAPSSPAEAVALAKRIGARYGSDLFPEVREIRFTARETGDGGETVRHWTWFPASDSVYFQGPDPKGLVLQAGYNRGNKWSLGSGTIAGIDRLFLRDRLALLFPTLIGRDRRTSFGMGEGGWLEVAYPAQDAEGAETYAVLADPDGTIRAWKVPANGPDPAGTRFEWSPPRTVDGLPLSLERRGPEGARIRFTDVKVEGLVRLLR
jgi:hypothetical protein